MVSKALKLLILYSNNITLNEKRSDNYVDERASMIHGYNEANKAVLIERYINESTGLLYALDERKLEDLLLTKVFLNFDKYIRSNNSEQDNKNERHKYSNLDVTGTTSLDKLFISKHHVDNMNKFIKIFPT